MGLAETIAYFRRAEEELFTEAVLVERRTASGAFNPGTGTIGAPTVQTVYVGPGNLRSHKWEGTDVTTGEREVRLRGTRVKLPADTGLQKDDDVFVTSSIHDADLVGRVYRVTDVLHDGWQIVRVAIVEEVTE